MAASLRTITFTAALVMLLAIMGGATASTYKDDKYYSPPYPTYEPPTYHEHDDHYDVCKEYEYECDFKFQYGGVPTFNIKARGDNAYGPVIVDKYGHPTKVLNANGKCKVFGYGYSCKDNFYFQHNRVATRTFNIRPVQKFKGKCIRLDITSAQLYDNSNLNPYDGNDKYPEDRRCVIFATK